MSHQSGIEVSQSLLDLFSEAFETENIRSIKVSIADEKLVESGRKNVHTDWETDYNEAVVPFLKPKEPCYLFVRVSDSKSIQSKTKNTWILISYVPDDSPVRSKMLYASTRMIIKTAFGTSSLRKEIFATTPADVNLDGYQKSLLSENAPPPFTAAEIEKNEIKKIENTCIINTGVKKTFASSIQLPIDPEVKVALEELKAHTINYAQLSISISEEIIRLERKEVDMNVDHLQEAIPKNSPSYHFFLFHHSYQGESFSQILFIYCCPGYQCQPKERMLYSSSRNRVVEFAEKEIGFVISRKLELGDLESETIHSSYLLSELHPETSEKKEMIKKPDRPGRGPRKLIQDIHK